MFPNIAGKETNVSQIRWLCSGSCKYSLAHKMVKAEANLQPALNAWDTMVASFSKLVSRSHPGENHQNELV